MEYRRALPKKERGKERKPHHPFDRKFLFREKEDEMGAKPTQISEAKEREKKGTVITDSTGEKASPLLQREKIPNGAYIQALCRGRSANLSPNAFFLIKGGRKTGEDVGVQHLRP